MVLQDLITDAAKHYKAEKLDTSDMQAVITAYTNDGSDPPAAIQALIDLDPWALDTFGPIIES